jgi:hypothetical protein
MRFTFSDPSGKNAALQVYTGAFGYNPNPGDNAQTVAFGYPANGDLQDCNNDGVSLCKWEGGTRLISGYHLVPGVKFGRGSSGGPFIFKYDQNTNLGYLYSNIKGYSKSRGGAIAPAYSYVDFYALLDYVSNH